MDKETKCKTGKKVIIVDKKDIGLSQVKYTSKDISLIFP